MSWWVAGGSALGGYLLGSSSGGGNSSSSPSSESITTSNIAPWAQPGVQSLIQSGLANVYPAYNPTTGYLGNQSGYTPFNANQAQTSLTNNPTASSPYVMGSDGQPQKDANGNYVQNPNYNPMAQALQSAQSTTAGFTPLQQQSFNAAQNMQMPGQYGQATDLATQAGQGNLGTTQGAGLYGQAGYNAGMSYGQNAQNVNGMPSSTVQNYMNPYLQATLAPSMQLLNQQYGMQQAQNQGAQTQAGAFGGSRGMLQNQLNQQNQLLATNQLVGGAYNQAYNTANQNMQNAATLGMQGAQAGLSGIGAQQAGYNAAGNAGTNLANIGTQQLGAQQGIAGLQNAYGAQQQQQAQNTLNQGMANYSTMQQYPMQQLAQLESLYSGAPQNVTTQNYTAAPSMISQVAGLGLAGYGLNKSGILGNSSQSSVPGGKQGGRVKGPDNRGGLDKLKTPGFEKFAEGGIVGFYEGDQVKDKKIDYRQMIIDQAKAKGIDPNIALALSGAEGAGKNPKSSANGYFQMIDKTFKDYGGDPEKRSDPAEQIRVGTNILADNTKRLTKSLGRAPTPSELYATHFLGEPTGTALLRTDPSMSVSDFLETVSPKKKDQIIKANPEILGTTGDQTVGQVRETLASKINKYLPIGSAQAGTLPQTQAPAQAPAPTQAPAQAPAQQSAPWYQGLVNKASEVGTAVTHPSKEGLMQLMPGLGENAYNIAGFPMDVGHQVTKVFGNKTPDEQIIGSSAYLKKKFTDWGIRPPEPTDAAARGYRTLGELGGLAINPVTATESAASLAGRAGTLGERAFNKISPAQGFTPEGLAALKTENAPVQASGQIPLRLTPPSAPIKPGTTVPVTTGGQGIIDAQEALTRERLANEAADRLAASKVEQPLTPIQGLNEVEQATSPTANAIANSTRLGAINSSGSNATMPSAGTSVLGGPGSPGWGMDLGQEGLASATSPAPAPGAPDTGTPKAPATSTSGGINPDFFMNLGLGMMAGKSPYTLQNVGEAGLGALKSIQEQKKADVEAQYMQAKIKEANASVDPAELRLARALSPTGDVDEGFRRLTELKKEKFDPRAAYNQYILGREKLQATPGVDLPQMMDFPTYARQFYPATTAPGNATIRER